MCVGELRQYVGRSVTVDNKHYVTMPHTGKYEVVGYSVSVEYINGNEVIDRRLCLEHSEGVCKGFRSWVPVEHIIF